MERRCKERRTLREKVIAQLAEQDPEEYKFIEDNEKGDLHRVSTKWGFPMFKVGKKGYYQETVRKYNGERLHVSWYARENGRGFTPPSFLCKSLAVNGSSWQ